MQFSLENSLLTKLQLGKNSTRFSVCSADVGKLNSLDFGFIKILVNMVRSEMLKLNVAMKFGVTLGTDQRLSTIYGNPWSSTRQGRVVGTPAKKFVRWIFGCATVTFLHR